MPPWPFSTAVTAWQGKNERKKKLNKEKERNVLLSQASDRTQTLGKETRAGEKKEFPKKRRFFIAVLVNKSDL